MLEEAQVRSSRQDIRIRISFVQGNPEADEAKVVPSPLIASRKRPLDKDGDAQVSLCLWLLHVSVQHLRWRRTKSLAPILRLRARHRRALLRCLQGPQSRHRLPQHSLRSDSVSSVWCSSDTSAVGDYDHGTERGVGQERD